MSGIWPVSSQLDAVGGITKSVIDLAVLTTSLVDPDSTKLPTPKGFEEYLSRNFQGLQIGFLDPHVWRFPPDLVPPIDAIDRQIVSVIILQYLHSSGFL